jgi:hypothetical protein
MELARRIRWIALSLPVVVAAAATLARPAPPGVLAAAALPDRGCAPAAGVSLSEAAWSRLDPVLDASGTLAAEQLTVGRGTARWTERLAPESFAAAPVNGRVLVGDDDGTRSRLRVLDTATGCWISLGIESAVVRSGVLAADGAVVYEHRVERGTRRDLGVWRQDLRAGRSSVAVLPGLAEDRAYGPTFTTSLLVAGDGRLVVSSCGIEECRIRVTGARGTAVNEVDGTGPAVRMDGDRLIVEEACEGLPCPLDAVDLGTGAKTRLAEVQP